MTESASPAPGKSPKSRRVWLVIACALLGAGAGMVLAIPKGPLLVTHYSYSVPMMPYDHEGTSHPEALSDRFIEADASIHLLGWSVLEEERQWALAEGPRKA